MKTAVGILLGLCACGSAVDTTGLESIADYPSWPMVTETKNIPGHPESVRIIYYNDVAASYPHGGRYPIGTAIVKEIHEKLADNAPGDLRYIAIMRKVAVDANVPTNDGWLFTAASKLGADEKQNDSCFNSCHRAGPFDGTWHDFGANP